METDKALEQQLLQLTQHFLQESKALRAARSLTLLAQLEQDLGIGSLEKAELFHRIEKQFDIQLPESLLVSSRTLNDIKEALIKLSSINKLNLKEAEAIKCSNISVDLTQVNTLVDVIVSYVENDSDRPYIFLQEGDSEQIITYRRLYEGAVSVANGLRALHVSEGDTVAIMLPTTAEFFFAFYGVLFAGAIPVPIYPPMRVDQIEEYAHKEAKILYNAGVKLLISPRRARSLTKLLQPFVPTLTQVVDVSSLMKPQGQWTKPELEEDDIALLQYTSGSTGNPKGVTLTHGNLLANIRAYGEGAHIRPDDVVVSWLPLYHDMGLIGTVMGCLYYGIPLILMSPLAFLSRPEKWLWTIHYRRATLSAAPNFAYELCAKKINDEDLEGLDLSSWRLALNGAEAIYPRTMDNFYNRFKKFGFSKKAFFPVYGLAESSVALTFPPVGREPLIDFIDKDAFEKSQKALPATSRARSYEFVSCGSALKAHKVRIVDEHDKVLPERTIGNLQFCGPSSMQGYYRNSESTEAVYHAGWWDSGDLAYLVDGEVFITGRKKDLIIKAGRNYYPQEIEDAASDVAGVRQGCVAAFGVVDKKAATEKLVIIAERNPKKHIDEATLITEITQSINTRIGVSPDDVVLVEPRTIPKTSSGKLRRSNCKMMYVDGSISKPKKSTWVQIIRLFATGSAKRLKKLLVSSVRFVYTLYVLGLLLITFLPLRMLVALLSQKQSQRCVKGYCNLMLRLAFCRLKKIGVEKLALEKQQLFIANHTSYMDVIALISVLPAKTKFVAKSELLKVPLLGGLLKRLGHIFIKRLDITNSNQGLIKVAAELERGNSVLFFPEGTFTSVTGVRPFKLGPFKLSAQQNIPVCPVALKNVRSVLRAGSFLLSPRPMTVTILSPKSAKDDSWVEISSLRDWARQEISTHCGEKPIDLISHSLKIQKS